MQPYQERPKVPMLCAFVLEKRGFSKMESTKAEATNSFGSNDYGWTIIVADTFVRFGKIKYTVKLALFHHHIFCFRKEC